MIVVVGGENDFMIVRLFFSTARQSVTDYAKLQTFSQQSILYSLEMMNDDMPCVLKLSDRSCCCKISVLASQQRWLYASRIFV